MRCASQIIGKLALTPAGTRTLKEDPLLDVEEIACAAWGIAVGKRLANHTRATKLVRGRLVVEVADATWQRSLFPLTRHVLSNVEKAIGPGIVTAIEFRIMPPRREPLRAMAATPLLDGTGVSSDDADGIGDPGLRRLYKSSRVTSRAKGMA